MGYRATWNSTDQIPARAIDDGRIGRFGLVDSSDGGESSRYSASFEWQRTNGNASTRLTAYGLKYDLDLFSNFTYFLDDPVNGDQFQQTDHRFVSGARVSHRRIGRWAGRPTQNTFGAQFRNDQIGDVGLYHTRERERLETIRRGRSPPDKCRDLRAERNGMDALAQNAGGGSSRRLSFRRGRRDQRERRDELRRASSARRAARSSGRSPKPSSTPTRAWASTATMRAARRSRSIP